MCSVGKPTVAWATRPGLCKPIRKKRALLALCPRSYKVMPCSRLFSAQTDASAFAVLLLEASSLGSRRNLAQGRVWVVMGFPQASDVQLFHFLIILMVE